MAMTRRQFVTLSGASLGAVIIAKSSGFKLLTSQYEITAIPGSQPEKYLKVTESEFRRFSKALKPQQKFTFASAPGEGLLFGGVLATPYRVKGWTECSNEIVGYGQKHGVTHRQKFDAFLREKGA